MVIYKTIEEIKEKFDILDSIICDVKWDDNLLDLIITVDYYEGKSISEKLYKIRLKDCFEANFKMPKNMKETPISERKGYIWSWYTALHMDVIKTDCIEVNIITNMDTNWLHAKCEEICIED